MAAPGCVVSSDTGELKAVPRSTPFAQRPSRPAVWTAWLALLFGLTFQWAGLQAEGLEQQRQRFLDARSALRSGDRERFQALAVGLEAYPLYPYLRYAELDARIGRTSPTEVREFLRRFGDTPLAARLRRNWLRQLAGRGEWALYREFYAPEDDPVLACHALSAWLRTEGQDAILEAAKTRWLSGRSQPTACDPAFAVLERSRLMSAALIWKRIGLAMAEGQLGLARSLGQRLDPPDRAWVARWCEAHERPLAVLGDPALREDRPIARTVTAHAIMHLAKEDARMARARLQALRSRFGAEAALAAEVERRLALEASGQGLPEACEWLDGVAEASVNDAVQRAQLRSALLAGDWARLARWTERAAAPDMNPLRWRYWRARALDRTGRSAEARALLEELARERDYYGFAAADRLGSAYRMGHRPVPGPPEVEAGLRARPGMVRAAELRLAGMPAEARAEWRHTTDALAVPEALVAARLADAWGWHDEVIGLLGRLQAYDDLELRFPMPYASLVRREAARQGLEPALLYSLIRAESGFNERARSSAGALGLMQLMPATARLVAADPGMGFPGDAGLTDPGTNLALGSRYLRDMLDRYAGHLPMTAAAYNAGPGRVERWRPEGECRDGEIWVETIPYTETRRYVRNILYFTALYEWRLNAEVRPIHGRIAAVPPRGDTLANRIACAKRGPQGHG